MDAEEIIVAVVVPVSMILIILFLYKDPVIYFFRNLFSNFEEKIDISYPEEKEEKPNTVRRRTGRFPKLF